MSGRTFWRVIGLIFFGGFYLTWFILVFFFYILPMLSFYATKRMHLRNKIKRQLVKNGLPRKVARQHARRYRLLLKEIGSLQGIIKLARISRVVRSKDKTVVPEENSKNAIPNE
jgi:hypothetical protein